MNKDTEEKLIALRLNGMLQSYREQHNSEGIETMTFEQRLALMVDAETDYRHIRMIERLVKNAQFSDKNASIEGIQYYPDRQLNKDLITELSTNEYIQKGQNIMLIGATGSGKSYLACALGNCACQAGIRVKYIRMPDLLSDIKIGLETGDYKKVLKKYQKTDLLILDEWLLIPADNDEQKYILEIVERRYKDKATIFCSQFSVNSWHNRLGGGALADAILDRITSKSKTISIKGDKSMRTR